MNTKFNSVSMVDRLSFARFEAVKQNNKPGFYPGVLIIEKGPAKGHFAVKQENGNVVNYDSGNPDHAKLQKYPIHIGDVTLDDVVRCGNEDEFAKCKLDHGATARDIIGDYALFRRDGDQVRADLSLMENTPHRAQVEELISRYAKKIGNSIDFDYVYDIKGNVAVARCVKLNSVDIVDAPAATNSLFKKQINPTYDMPLSPEDLAAIGTVIDTKLSVQETKFNSKFEEIKTKMEEGEETEEEKKKREEKEAADEEKKKLEEGKDEKKDDAKLQSMIKTATLAAVREVLPKATLENLASMAQHQNKKDPYEEKVELAIAAGISPAKVAFHISRTFPAIYNAKFGAPVTNKSTL